MVYPYQIYRHFKGNFYLVLSVALSSSDLEPTVVYMSLNGGSEVWTRSLSEFESLVPENKVNPTGQEHRFEHVKDIRSTLSLCTTKSLVEELKNRPDSPFNERDIEGFNNRVAMSEYVLGETKSAGDDLGVYLEPIMSAHTYDEVKKFAQNNPHRYSKRSKIFKRILVEVESFD